MASASTKNAHVQILKTSAISSEKFSLEDILRGKPDFEWALKTMRAELHSLSSSPRFTTLKSILILLEKISSELKSQRNLLLELMEKNNGR